MPTVTIKAKQHEARTPEKIDALMQELRGLVAKHLEVPVEKVLVIYEELAAGIYYDGGPARPRAAAKPHPAGRGRGVKV
jgi:phenylpyruvate tautomerase PptA (4-oxalocrotonate tautomerase family)